MSALDGWIDICRVGTWKDMAGRTATVTEDMLDTIVRQFASGDPVPVVVGHPKDNAPAYAWIDQVRRTGDRLQAKLRDIAPAFRAAVESNAYAGRSISFANGKLRHLGFLGGTAPAVPGLSPTQFADDGADAVTVELAATDEGSLVAQDSEGGLRARERAVEAREAALALAEARTAVGALLEPHIKAGRVLPGEKDRLIAIGARLHADAGGPVQFAASDEEVSMPPWEAFDGFLSALPQRVDFNTELATGQLPAPPRRGGRPRPDGSARPQGAGADRGGREARGATGAARRNQPRRKGSHLMEYPIFDLASADGIALASGPFDTQTKYTQIAMSVPVEGLIADMVSPRVRAPYKFTYTKLTEADELSLPESRASRAGKLNEVEFGSTDETDSTKDYGLICPVPDRDVREARTQGLPYDPLSNSPPHRLARS